ncbi:MAG: hypothetical protein IBJ11_02035 [Phycisphaerales bacterium]|nr:hypothetical protein [Phycisphaerales bacterium]
MKPVESSGQVGNGVRGGLTYLNGVLTAIAVLLGVLVLQRGFLPGASVAQAQSSSADPSREPVARLPDPAEQTNRVIESLGRIDASVKRLESLLTKGGISVKVTEMPAASSRPSR